MTWDESDTLPLRARLRAWWRRFVRRNLVADDPHDAALDRAALAQRVVYGRTGPGVPLKWGGVIASRVIPMVCRKPDGSFEMGWSIKAHNDGERVEVLLAWLTQTMRRQEAA